MSSKSSTLQSVDPLGALAGRPLTILAAVSATVLAVVLTAAQPSQIANPALAVAALAVAALASAVLVLLTAPTRTPVSAWSPVLIAVLGFAAEVLFAAATWGRNTLVRDDWGPFVLGLLLLALCPYRPPRQLVLVAVVVSVLSGVVTIVETRFFIVGAPPSVYVMVSVVPILALALAGAAFARTVLVRIERWRRRAERASIEHAETQEEGIVRSVQQSRVTILNRDVVPLFTELLDSGRVTAETSARAAEVSGAIRSVMVAETRRTWLDDLVSAGTGGAGGAVLRTGVTDPERLAERMSFDQRAAMRALVSALGDRVGAQGVRVELERAGEVCRVLLRCSSDLDHGVLTSALAPYLAVLRVVFEDIALDTSHPDLTLRFSYVCN